MSARDDLAHLSPEALMQATNAGLVKRAQRELAAGYRPQLALDADGTLRATFSDGIATTWPPGRTLQQSACTCAAAGACRHRVIAALAWREQAQAGATPAPRPVEQADDAAIERVVPEPLRALARRLHDQGVTVEVRRTGSGEPCETARLPDATVRFWAGAALEAARCDCARAAACEHVALGAWAFRAAAAAALQGAVQTVRLGDAGAGPTLDRAAFDALAETLLAHGVARGVAPLAQAFSLAHAAAADAAWLQGLVADLERWGEGYARRSALYEPVQGVDLLAELGLRLAAGAQPGRARAVFGLGLAGETPMDRLRLIGLGARTVRDGEARRTSVALADADTGTALVLRHDWRVADALRAQEAALRAAERIAPGVMLDALATGQVLARKAARRPDGSVRVGGTRNADQSVLAQNADWSLLGAPLRHGRVATLARELRAQPNPALRARLAVGRFVVFTPARLGECFYDPDEQAVLGVLFDADEQPVVVERRFERHVPFALDALAGALTGRFGALRHVSGLLRWRAGTAWLEPWALACDGIVVPDVAVAAGAVAALPIGSAPPPDAGAAAGALGALRELLGALLHHGVAQLPQAWPRDAAALARRLSAEGFAALGERLAALAPELAARRAQPGTALPAAAVQALAALRQLHDDALVLAALGPEVAVA